MAPARDKSKLYLIKAAACQDLNTYMNREAGVSIRKRNEVACLHFADAARDCTLWWCNV